ncbi:MAG: DUF2073 domain-containing protein [Patescibacteria group bacterium]|nr:DUF2073 domain-containing protein [Patescibacteria group bacterium]
MLTLQFIPYTEIEGLNSEERIKKLLKEVKTDKIVLMEGRLKSNEEADLITKTMESISDKFTGIELSVIFPEAKELDFFKKIRHKFINVILGDRRGMTIIGPANVVEEIKQDPEKIQLFTKASFDSKTKKVKSKKKTSSKKKTTKTK